MCFRVLVPVLVRVYMTVRSTVPAAASHAIEDADHHPRRGFLATPPYRSRTTTAAPLPTATPTLTAAVMAAASVTAAVDRVQPPEQEAPPPPPSEPGAPPQEEEIRIEALLLSLYLRLYL